MDVIFILVPLLSGYYFASGWYRTKFKIGREDGHRLYFRSASFAVFLAFFAIILRTLLLKIDIYKSAEEYLCDILSGYLSTNNNDQQFSLLILSIYTLLIAPLIRTFCNICTDRDQYLEEAIRDDDFEKLLYRAARRGVPVNITMDNNKVYIGFVIETSDPTLVRKAITLFTLVSGYCELPGHKLKLTTNYRDIRNGLESNSIENSDIGIDDFYIVLPTEKIQSARMFDFAVYKKFLTDSKRQQS